VVEEDEEEDAAPYVRKSILLCIGLIGGPSLFGDANVLKTVVEILVMFDVYISVDYL
jgi:hypothetical protein